MENNANNKPQGKSVSIGANAGNGEFSIDIMDVLRTVLNKWWLILLVAVCCAAITFVIFEAVYVDTYTSEGNIYLVTNVSESSSTVNVSDAKFADTFMNDYLEDLGAKANYQSALSLINPIYLEMYNTEGASEAEVAALKQEIEEKTSGLTLKQLMDSCKIWNEKDTHFLYVSVKSTDPKLSYVAATAVLRSSVERLKDFYGVEQVDIRTQPSLETKPDSSGQIKYTLLAGLIGALIVIAIFVLIYIRDDKINTAEDVEQYLGLSVLAMIPVYNPDDSTADGNGNGRGR